MKTNELVEAGGNRIDSRVEAEKWLSEGMERIRKLPIWRSDDDAYNKISHAMATAELQREKKSG